MISLSIAQKGLLIVFIPFVLNIAWIGMYLQSLNGSSVLLSDAAKKGNIIFLMSSSVGLFNKTGTSLFDFVKTSGNEAVKARIRKESAEILQTLKLLADELPADSPSKLMVERLTVMLSGIRQSLDSLADKADLSESDVVAIELPHKFLAVMKETHGLLSALDDGDRSFGITLEEQRVECRRTRFIVLTGLLLNLAIALALALFFKLTVVKRISEVSFRTSSLISGTVVSLPVTARDELSKLESELVDAGKKLADADRFRRIYMTAVAKRLQNSLRRCLQDSSEIRQDSEITKNDGEKYLRRLDASVSSCLSLIEDMLVLESMDLGTLQLSIEEADLQEIISNSIEIVSNLAIAKQLSVENHCTKIILPMDVARVRQVLVNLLSNAIKFSTTGSSVLVRGETKDSFIRISVIDSGPGISKQASVKLFQKFFQTSEGKSAGGTGLGLAIAKLIIESHGGLIGVDSTLGEGSSFWIELPLHQVENPST